jgi:hypothetical protein
MIRTVIRFCTPLFMIAAVLAGAMSAQPNAWAATPSGLSAAASNASASISTPDDDQDENPSLMTMGDFNRDGIADVAEIISGDAGSSMLKISLGQPDGTYKQTEQEIKLDHSAQSIVAGDFNRDGNVDLIVGDDGGAVKLFLGDGTGKMVFTENVAALDSVTSIVVSDFNHDGILDLAISDWRASSIEVLLGVGDGSFRPVWSSPLRMPGTVPHLVVADFNKDQIPDLAVVYDNDDGDTFEVMLGGGNGTFMYSPGLSFVRDPNSHCAT